MAKNELFNTAIVEKSNILNEFKADNLKLQEIRFLSIYLAKINPCDETTRTIRFSLLDFQKIMEFGKLNIKQLKESTDNLLGKKVSIPLESGGYETIVLFVKCRVDKDSNGEWFVEISASNEAMPLMFDFKDRYFKYELWNVLGLTSKNQFRMYEILKQYENIGRREISVEQLKDWLGISPDEYKRFGDFKVYVLEACQRALKEKTDIYYEFKRGKTGRGGKWLTIIFTIHKNKDYKSPVNLEAFTKICPELKENLAKKDTYGYTKNKYVTPRKKPGLPSFEYKQWDFEVIRKIIDKTGEGDEDYDE